MATFEVEANGETYEIEAPDEATALKAFQSFSGGATEQPKAPTPPAQGFDPLKTVGDAATAFQAGTNQGMTLGFGDEIAAGMMAPIVAVGPMLEGKGYDIGKGYNEALDFTRGKLEEDQAKNPIAAGVGDVAGSVLTGGTLAKGGVTLLNGAKATIPSIAARSAAEGAIYGGISGAGRADGDNLQDAAEGAYSGALWGAGTGAALGGVVGALASRNANKAVPTVEELKQAADDLYDAAEATGVTFGRNEVKTVADDIAAKAISEGIDPTLHPRANAALQRLQQAGDTGMTVKNVQTMRRILAAAGKDPMNPDEARIAGMMVEQFDNMVGAKTPELALARKTYHQAKKGELIEQSIELASARAGGQMTGPGFADAVRVEFKALERAIIKNKLKGLTAAEKSAIRHVARGGAIENVVRWAGKFAPSGVVSASASGGVPFALGTALSGGNVGVGAAAAGATMGLGYAARAAAAKMAAANAARASATARNGGVPANQVGAADLAALQALVPAAGIEAPRAQVPVEIIVRGGNPLLAR